MKIYFNTNYNGYQCYDIFCLVQIILKWYKLQFYFSLSMYQTSNMSEYFIYFSTACDLLVFSVNLTLSIIILYKRLLIL